MPDSTALKNNSMRSKNSYWSSSVTPAPGGGVIVGRTPDCRVSKFGMSAGSSGNPGLASVVAGLLICCLVVPGASRVAWGSGPLADEPQLQSFVHQMSARHGFDKQDLGRLLRQAKVLEGVLKAIARPAEAKPWYQYRRIFVTPARIGGGIEFWRKHHALLERAGATYGVAPEVIVAIIGVETRYGQHLGRYRVLDALVTLAFRYPRRSRFFRSELEHFLLLAREEGLRLGMLYGSYAGALGIPQFIASSYRRYAVDFDGDGVRDLFNSPADAIGSVANYLSEHGWRRGESVAFPATVGGSGADKLVAHGLKPHATMNELRKNGVLVDGQMEGGQLAALIRLETESGNEHWVGLQNFYAITRYNHSALYAMAVNQLAAAIREQYRALG